MQSDELELRWPEKPDCTRDRLLHLLDVFSDEPDSLVITRPVDEATLWSPGVVAPESALTLGDLRILADVAVAGEYALDGETGSEIQVER